MSENNSRVSIYQSTKYIYYYLKLAGLAIFNFNEKSLELETTIRHYFALLLVVITLLFVNFLQFKTIDEYSSEIQFKVLDNLWRNQYLFQIICTTPIIIFNFIKRNSLEVFLKQIHQFDELLYRLNWKFQVQHSKKLSVIILLFPIILVVYILVLAENYLDGYVVRDILIFSICNTGYITIMNIFFVINVLFIGSCYCVLTRLDALLKNLR